MIEELGDELIRCEFETEEEDVDDAVTEAEKLCERDSEDEMVTEGDVLKDGETEDVRVKLVELDKLEVPDTVTDGLKVCVKLDDIDELHITEFERV